MKQAKGASQAAQSLLLEKQDSHEKSGGDSFSESSSEETRKLRNELAKIKEELAKARVERDTMKKQAESVSKEYDRLTEEYSKVCSTKGTKKDD